MTSKAFVASVWCLLLVIFGVGLAVISASAQSSQSGPAIRAIVLYQGGAPALVFGMPLLLLLALPFSKRLL